MPTHPFSPFSHAHIRTHHQPDSSPPGLTQWACYIKASAYGSRVGCTPARRIHTYIHILYFPWQENQKHFQYMKNTFIETKPAMPTCNSQNLLKNPTRIFLSLYISLSKSSSSEIQRQCRNYLLLTVTTVHIIKKWQELGSLQKSVRTTDWWLLYSKYHFDGTPPSTIIMTYQLPVPNEITLKWIDEKI